MKKRGFTLIEMLIVIVIIGILAGALIPRIGSAREKANDTAREANVRSLATAMVSYGMDHSGYPETTAATTAITLGGGTVNGHLLTTSLTGYSIPSGNFSGQPTSADRYFYTKMNGGDHFVIYALLSGGPNSEGGNCLFSTVSSTGLTYDQMNAMTTGDSFCYFQ